MNPDLSAQKLCSFSRCSLQLTFTAVLRLTLSIQGPRAPRPSIGELQKGVEENHLSVQKNMHSPQSVSILLIRFSDPINLRTSIQERGHRKLQRGTTFYKWRRTSLTGQGRVWMDLDAWVSSLEVGRRGRSPSTEEGVGRFLPNI